MESRASGMQPITGTSDCGKGHRMSGRLGELLVKESSITPAQLELALEHQRKHGGRLGSSLVGLGFMTAEEITAILSRQYGIPSINLKHFEADPSVIRLIPMETALKYQVLPLSRVGASLTLAMADPANIHAMDDIKSMTGFHIEPVVASEVSIAEAIKENYGSIEEQERKKEIEELVSFVGDGQTESVEVETEDESSLNLAASERRAEEVPVIKLVNHILADAVQRGVSDIHLEPYEKEYRVRYRMDGLLQNAMQPPIKLRDAMISRIKIMAKLDISEKRLPQDGRIMVRMVHNNKNKQLEFRVSVLPTLYGEKIVMRVLDKANLRLDMTNLGFEPESLEKFQRAILKPYGMILVAGPAGSGKTSTLYSCISQLSKPDINILTAEDPVEFQMPGINQVEMKEQIGLNFAAALRSFLRQDPNIMMVGEIPDFETAEIATKAALTGHVVFSTLPTMDAPSTISRLVNMGIEPFLVATAVRLICAQRLTRRICPQCKVENKISPQLLVDAGFSPQEARTLKTFHGEGCAACNNRGFRGRIGLYEVLEVNDALRELILAGASALELRKKAIEHGMISLRRSGLLKIAAGVTTLEEVIRETVL